MRLTPLILMLCCSAALAQPVLHGRVQSGGKPVAFAHVRAGDSGTVADAEGQFSCRIPAGTTHLEVSAIGYRRAVVALPTTGGELRIDLEEEAHTLDDIVVSGVARATQTREHPMPVVVITEKLLGRQQSTNLIDALAMSVPGLHAVKTGPNVSKPFIRGLGYNRVLTLYDGIRQEGQQWGDEHGIEADGYQIEKAEVIKGPASLAFGSDAVAGVVSLLPYTPPKEGGLQGRFITEYQHNNGMAGTSLRLAQGGAWSWAVTGSSRVARNYRNAADGFVYNTGFREQHLAVMVRRQHQSGNSRIGLTLYDNQQGIPDGSRDSLTRRFTRQVLEADLDDPRRRPVVSDADLRSYSLSALRQHISHYRLYSHHQWLVGRSDVTATLGYSLNRRREYNHPTATALAGMNLALHTVNGTVRWNLPEWKGLESNVGVNGMWQLNQILAATNFPIPTYRLGEWGIFSTTTYRKGRFTFNGGGRMDRRAIAVDDFYTSVNPATGFSQQADAAAVGAQLVFPALQQNFTGLSAGAGMSYRWTDHLQVKLNVARGYRAPSMAEITSNGLDPGAHIVYLGNRNFKAEYNWQFDAGVELHRPQVSGSISLFHNTLHHFIYLAQLLDAQGNVLRDAQGNRTFQYQQASAQLYGGEVSVELTPAAITGFKWSTMGGLCYGFNRRADFRGTGTQGEYLPFIPPAHVRTTLEQEFKGPGARLPHWRLLVSSEIFAAQDRYLELHHTETATSGYTLFHAGIGADVHVGKLHYQVQVQCNNLFDTIYQSNLSRLKYFEYYAVPEGARSGIYGMGRNASIKITLVF